MGFSLRAGAKEPQDTAAPRPGESPQLQPLSPTPGRRHVHAPEGTRAARWAPRGWDLGSQQKAEVCPLPPLPPFPDRGGSLVPSAGGGEGGGAALPSVRTGSGVAPLPPSAGRHLSGHRLPTSCPVSAHLAALAVRCLCPYLRACGRGAPANSCALSVTIYKSEHLLRHLLASCLPPALSVAFFKVLLPFLSGVVYCLIISTLTTFSPLPQLNVISICPHFACWGKCSSVI